MKNYEEVARKYHNDGNNCSVSVFRAFQDDYSLVGCSPLPRSEGGKCGALLAAEAILNELGKKKLIPSFEKDFQNYFGSLTCVDLIRTGKSCNDCVGFSARNLYKYLS